MSETQLNPFPGLRSFEPNEDHLFFGRETQIDDLLKRLRITRFLSVIGSSGSGKSSLIRSGVIPALFSGFMVGAGSSWRISVFRPGDNPMGNLTVGLQEPVTFEVDDDFDDLYEPEEGEDLKELDSSEDQDRNRMRRAMMETTLSRGSRGLIEAVRQLELDEDENLLVVVDQFEELFRFKRESEGTTSNNEAAAFVKLLLTASAQKDLPIYVVLTMRSDFLENCTEFSGLTEAINQGQYLVPRMTREQRRAAITGPVAVGGAEIVPRLVMRLLNDVGNNPDQLPIMQHALMRTWDYWQKNHVEDEPIDLRHYEAIGSMREALSLHAEEAYQEQLSEHNKTCAHNVFTALTEKGQDGRGIRRPTTIEEICAVTGVSENSVLLVVERFRQPGRSFLVPPSNIMLESKTTLDISHESLMRVWTRLRDWVEEEAQSAKLYRALAHAAAGYHEGLTGLYRDPELQMALRWKKESQPNAAWADRYDPTFERAMIFLERGREERDRATARRERIQKLQLRRSRMFAGIFALFTLVFLALGTSLFLKSRETEKYLKEARKEKSTADIKRKEAEDAVALAEKAKAESEAAKQTIKEQKDEAVELQVAAQGSAEDADKARKQALENLDVAKRERLKAIEQTRLAEKAEADAVKAKNDANAAAKKARDEQLKAKLAEKEAETNLTRSRNLLVLDFARELAGKVLGLQQQDPELAALAALKAYFLTRDHTPDRDNRIGEPEIHRALSTALQGLNSRLERSYDGGDAVRAMALDPHRDMLLVGNDSGQIFQLDLSLPDAPITKAFPINDAVRSIAVNPVRTMAAIGARNGDVHMFSWEENKGNPEYRLLTSHQRGVTALAFSPDGQWLASAGAAGELRVHPLDARDGEPGLLQGFGDKIWSVAFHPRGKTLAIASSEGVALVSDFTNSRTFKEPFLLRGNTHALAFSKDGAYLAAGTFQGVLYLWTTRDFSRDPKTRNDHLASINSLEFSADGKILATAGSDHTVRLWNFQKEQSEPVVLTNNGSWVWSVTFNQDGSRLFSGNASKQVHRWVVPAAELAEDICSRLKREMTASEWQKLISESLSGEPLKILEEVLANQKVCSQPARSSDRKGVNR